jgi:hypothetical protein
VTAAEKPQTDPVINALRYGRSQDLHRTADAQSRLAIDQRKDIVNGAQPCS